MVTVTHYNIPHACVPQAVQTTPEFNMDTHYALPALLTSPQLPCPLKPWHPLYSRPTCSKCAAR